MPTTASYKYKTMTERAATGATAAAALTIYGVGLSAVFNPVVLGFAAAYGAYAVGKSVALGIPAYRKWAFNKMVTQGYAELLPESADICRMAKEISHDLGRKKTPQVYAISETMVAKMALPYGFRWLAKSDSFSRSLRQNTMPKIFAAIPGANTLLTTKQALSRGLTPDEMKFIVAHEMGHLKTDAGSPALLGRAFIKKAAVPLLLGTTAAMALSVFGFGLPVAAAGVGLLKTFGVFVATKMAAEAVVNTGMRVLERRADRNALYVTRDLESAVDAMDYLHEPAQKKPRSLLRETFLTHPSYRRRISAMRTAFHKVSKYPPLRPVNDNAAQKQAPGQLPPMDIQKFSRRIRV